MSYRESFQEAFSGNRRTERLPAEFVQQFPTLAEVLQGCPPINGDAKETPPASITLFVEVGRLKFVIRPRAGDCVAFGCLNDPRAGLAGLEEELKSGRFEWKRGKR